MRTIVCILLVIGCCLTWASGQQAQRRQRVIRPQQNFPRRSNGAGGNYQYRAEVLPAAYSILMTKSLFSRDHVSISDTPVRPTFNNTPPRQPNVVLRGVLREPDHILASVEDTGTRSITWLRHGDTVRAAGGAKVVEITLDHISVESALGRRTFLIGESIQPPARVASALPTTRPVSVVDR